MWSAHTRDVVTHYTRRHAERGDLFGNQPFANYGYWTRPGMSLEQAAEALTALVAVSAGIAAGDTVLDVGCGYGAGAVVVSQRCAPAHITGIDVTEIRIDEGQHYVARHGLAERVTLQLGDATAMQFADASFDKIMSVECAFHFDTRRDFLDEAARVLKPGGTLALTDMIPRRGVNPADYLRGEKTVNSGVVLDNLGNAYDAAVYAQHLQAAGFTDIRIESILPWTRQRFVEALDAVAAKAGGEKGLAVQRSAARIQQIIDGGEDYVLVVARKA